MKRISLLVLLVGAMVVFSAQKKNVKKRVEHKTMHGKKMSKVKLKALNLKLFKKGKIATMASTPKCNGDDSQTMNAHTIRVDVPGPPPQLCEQIQISCRSKADGSIYSKYGAYSRCAEKEPAETKPKTELRKLME